MTYKFDRQELEDAIRTLADTYPKCFFTNPRLRRPLKKNIIADLQKDVVPLAAELLSVGVDWYQSHLSYQLALQGGAKRIDLNGREIGTVTELEERTAKKKVEEINGKMLAKRQPLEPVKTAAVESRNDMAPIVPAKMPAVLPELARLYEAVVAANTAMAASMGNKVMRTAITTAVISVVIKEAQHVIEQALAGEGQGKLL